MKLLIYSEIFPGFGTGNLLRMAELYSYLSSFDNFEIDFITNNVNLAEQIFKEISLSINLLEKISNSAFYDVVIFDSSIPEKSMYPLIQLREQTKKIIAFDFFNYENNQIDILVNLYNHNRHDVNKFTGKIYEGPKYALLKDNILYERKSWEFKKNNDKSEILISFGGEDPNCNTRNILETLSFYNNYNVKIILGYLNKDKNYIRKKWGNRFSIIEPTYKIGELISKSDLVICGGGTTLLESIYLGNPVIAIPQNDLEKKFIDFIKSHITLFDLDDFINNRINLRNVYFRKSIHQAYCDFVDGKGKERIKKILSMII